METFHCEVDLMSKISQLEMAAIAAVLAASSVRNDPSQVGRNHGEPWSEDHRRMNMGMSSLMHKKSSRSPWK